MDDYARAIRAAEERGFQRGYHAGQNDGYNRGWREGVGVARGELDRLTGEVQRLLAVLGAGGVGLGRFTARTGRSDIPPSSVS